MSPTGRVLALQASIGIDLSAGFFLRSTTSGLSAGLALCCVIAPAAYYAWAQRKTFNATRLLLQGVSKMVLTMVLVAVSIVVYEIEPLGFFVTFAAMQAGYLGGLRFSEPPGGGKAGSGSSAGNRSVR